MTMLTTKPRHDDPVRVFQDIAQVVNGQISFGDGTVSPAVKGNIDGVHFSGSVPTANVDYTVTHNLGRIPTGFHTVNIDQFAILKKGSAAWTKKTLSLQSNVAGVNITIFVY